MESKIVPIEKKLIEEVLNIHETFDHCGSDEADIHLFWRDETSVLSTFGRIAVRTPQIKVLQVRDELQNTHFASPQGNFCELVVESASKAQILHGWPLSSNHASNSQLLETTSLGLSHLFLEGKIHPSHIEKIKPYGHHERGGWSARDGESSSRFVRTGWTLSDKVILTDTPWDTVVSRLGNAQLINTVKFI